MLRCRWIMNRVLDGFPFRAIRGSMTRSGSQGFKKKDTGIGYPSEQVDSQIANDITSLKSINELCTIPPCILPPCQLVNHVPISADYINVPGRSRGTRSRDTREEVSWLNTLYRGWLEKYFALQIAMCKRTWNLFAFFGEIQRFGFMPRCGDSGSSVCSLMTFVFPSMHEIRDVPLHLFVLYKRRRQTSCRID